MGSEYPKRNAAAAFALLARASRRCEPLPAVDEIKSTAELVQRARMLRSILKTRAMVQELRDRAADLESAIERFKDRKKKIAND